MLGDAVVMAEEYLDPDLGERRDGIPLGLGDMIMDLGDMSELL